MKSKRSGILRLKVFLTGIILLALAGGLPPIPQESVRSEEPVLFQEREIIAPLADDADRSSLQTAVERSLAQLAKNISASPPPGAGRNFSRRERTYHSLALFREILIRASDEGDFERRLKESFTFWEATRGGRANSILVTGYYELILEGDLKPGGEYLYPIYRRPDDLVELMSKESSLEGVRVRRVARVEKGQAIPYYSRREIDDQGALRGKGYELAWLKDPWERFLLHVQGSGQIRLPTGETLRVGFAGSNGRTYRSIGRYLVDRGFFGEKELCLERVKEFLRQNPERVAETFNVNERYIFFRFVPGKEGPIGALGIPLTAGRSIATDPAIFPPGALAYLVAQQPVFDESGRLKGRKILRRFVLNQDTGAAMKGPERVDLFLGSGEQAGMAAGEMREEGKIYLLQAR
jgi:membrane-bound lytic murein transglycosylase A